MQPVHIEGVRGLQVEQGGIQLVQSPSIARRDPQLVVQVLLLNKK